MRHAAIDAAKVEQLAGKRVLEIASHDGRWSFAAVTAGASCVVGVEPRSELIDSAQANLCKDGVDPVRFQFVQADVFDFLGTEIWRSTWCCASDPFITRHVELLAFV